MYGSFWPPFLSMKSSGNSECLTSVYEAWSCLGARTISLPFDTQRIATLMVVLGNSGRLLLAFLLVGSPKSVAGHLLPRLPFFLDSRISFAHIFKNISTHCRRINPALPKLTNGSKFANGSKLSATAVTQWRGPSRTCFKRFCPRIMD